MKKHILIHGNHEYLKALFIHRLIKGKTIEKINCEDSNIFESSFLINKHSEGKEILFFQNVNTVVNPNDFVPMTGACYEHKTDNNLKLSTPILIVGYSGRVTIPEEQSFLRRFHIINVDTLSFFEIKDFLDNGLRINTEE
ncbi:TPA: hypothetical protein ACG0AP_001249 [Elizabethkingia anophelis]